MHVTHYGTLSVCLDGRWLQPPTTHDWAEISWETAVLFETLRMTVDETYDLKVEAQFLRKHRKRALQSEAQALVERSTSNESDTSVVWTLNATPHAVFALSMMVHFVDSAFKRKGVESVPRLADVAEPVVKACRTLDHLSVTPGHTIDSVLAVFHARMVIHRADLESPLRCFENAVQRVPWAPSSLSVKLLQPRVDAPVTQSAGSY